MVVAALLSIPPRSLGSHSWLLVSVPSTLRLSSALSQSQVLHAASFIWEALGHTVLKPPSHHFCESLKHPRYSNISPLRLLLTSRSVSGILLQSNLDYPNKVTLYWTCPEPRNCLCFISPLKRQKPDMGGWGQVQHTVPLEL